MNNPWHTLPNDGALVLPADRPAITRYNSAVPTEKQIHLDLMPEPFLGSPEAPIVLLALNPGFSPDDYQWHQQEHFRKLSLGNLIHAPMQYPFYLLDPSISASPGAQWWRKRLRRLIEAYGADSVARSILCVEYFPYHSKEYGRRVPSVPSQQYSFHLVASALWRGALVIVMRAWNTWRVAVPALERYALLYRLKSPRSPYISLRNCPEGYHAIRKLLD